ncbi:MAG: type III-A CRISPR-associated RAMP protein Csm5, partial [Acidobacteria bacterium]|nr:type III-A CRISPR-associated RAMP protein Csm5 [Acidobacteriota bacterium]
MNYRLTALTPLLVGDGSRLSPIDYMVWRDQINVLDQRRIFRLLTKGPRLDGYLDQLKRAERLDFASWGGFAQNFAGRRIPFESPSCTPHWEKAATENLHIPTFVAGSAGPYLPGSALKGALRTGRLFAGLTEGAMKDLAARTQSDRPPRRPAEVSEDRLLGPAGTTRMKFVSVSDSGTVPWQSFKVYLLRVATLLARGQDRFELGWKQSPRGSVEWKRPEDSTPVFTEMAVPGTTFEGCWRENNFFSEPEIARAANWRHPVNRAQIFRASNQYAARLLALHKQYAQWTGLVLLGRAIEELEARLNAAMNGGDA